MLLPFVLASLAFAANPPGVNPYGPWNRCVAALDRAVTAATQRDGALDIGGAEDHYMEALAEVMRAERQASARQDDNDRMAALNARLAVQLYNLRTAPGYWDAFQQFLLGNISSSTFQARLREIAAQAKELVDVDERLDRAISHRKIAERSCDAARAEHASCIAVALARQRGVVTTEDRLYSSVEVTAAIADLFSSPGRPYAMLTAPGVSFAATLPPDPTSTMPTRFSLRFKDGPSGSYRIFLPVSDATEGLSLGRKLQRFFFNGGANEPRPEPITALSTRFQPLTYPLEVALQTVISQDGRENSTLVLRFQEGTEGNDFYGPDRVLFALMMRARLQADR